MGLCPKPRGLALKGYQKRKQKIRKLKLKFNASFFV